MHCYRKYHREIIVITCSQIPAKWYGIFDHINFTQVQRITAAALASYYPQSLFIHCKVHSTVSTPLVILLSRIVTARSYLSFHSLCEQIVLYDVICACSGMLQTKTSEKYSFFKISEICFHQMDRPCQRLSQVPRSYRIKGDIKLGKSSQIVVLQISN